MSRSQLTILIMSCLVLYSCRHQAENLVNPATGGGTTGGGGTGTGGGSTATPCDPSRVYFQQQVLPILLSNCAMSGCHDNASRQDGVILTSYSSVMSTAGVRPGRPGNSELYEVIIETDPDDRMPRPPRSPLSSDQKLLIRKWIEQGAQDLSCDNLCDTTSFTYSGAIRSIITNSCQGCHSGGSASGGIDLSTYNGLKSKITDGRLWGALNHQPGFIAMPMNGPKLSDCQLTQIRKWIDNGSPNN